jgi:hypothetical protein
VCNLGVLPASNSPVRVQERVRWAGSILEAVPLRMWKAHNKPWAMKGNACLWRAGTVVC